LLRIGSCADWASAGPATNARANTPQIMVEFNSRSRTLF
jgi:hypothetical protein